MQQVVSVRRSSWWLRQFVRLAPLAGSLVASGCMFLVDFDELKKGTGADAGAPGPAPEPAPNPTPSSAGGGGGNGPGPNSGGGGNTPTPSGGTGNTPAPPCAMDADCDDGDPCTTDTCSNTVCDNVPLECVPSNSCVASSTCVDGACVEEPLTGLVQDGLEFTLNGDDLYRTALIAGADRFFYAVYGLFNGAGDLRLGGFMEDGSDTLKPQSLASGLKGTGLDIASPGALVIDGNGDVNVYVGVRDTGAASSTPDLGEVLRVVFDSELSLAADNMARKQGTAASFRFVSDLIGPEAARVPGGEPFVVWPGRTAEATPRDGLFYQVGDDVVQVDAPGNGFTEVPDALSGLHAVYTESTPGAVWMTDRPSGGVQLFAGTAAGDTRELSQCDDDPGYIGYGLHAGLTLDDLWTVSWSKQGPGFTSENTVVQCAGTTCQDRSGVAVGDQCSTDAISERVNMDVRHLLVEAFPDAGDPNFLYQVILLAAEQDSGTTIAAVANRVDIGPDGTGSERVGSITVATGKAGAAPDWPEVAVIPPDRLAVSWLQPAADGSADQAHFARYRICP